MKDEEKIALVMTMFEAWREKDIEKMLSLFTEDGVLHSMMLPPSIGKDMIRKEIHPIAQVDSMDFDFKSIGVVDGKVIVERVDKFVYKGREEGAIPIVGILEFEGDLVKEWREYYDMKSTLEAMGLDALPD